jgi:PhzF family phenazine biosynthesis protein
MKLFQVDAFTNEIFKGNPAGVCIIPDNVSVNDVLLQNIALEMNVSETAFLKKFDGAYDLRWFTPETEVDFCGHATLSSAHILWEAGIEKNEDEIIFNTKSGKLFANRRDNKIELNFPSIEVTEIPEKKEINVAFGIKPLFIGSDNKRYLLEIDNYKELKEIKPDYNQLNEMGRTAFMITCKSDNNKYDFYSRFFAPSVGINEDPVTGSAHSYLTPYWAKKLNKNILNAYQASRRGGEIECELTNNKKVLLRGNAKTVFQIKMNGNITI